MENDHRTARNRLVKNESDQRDRHEEILRGCSEMYMDGNDREEAK